jgi:twinkle protein
VSDAITRIDAARLRKMGDMLASPDPKYDEAPALLDLGNQTAAQMLEEYARQQEGYQTAPFDWEGEHLRFYEGGVTIWSGFPGSGKTTLLRQFACHLMARKQGVFFGSLEEHPRNLVIGIACVAAGVPLKMVPTQAVLQKFLDRYQGQLRVWGKVGIASHREILSVIRKLAEQDIRHAIIDSLMCLDVSNDDFEGQRRFAGLVAATAKASGVHIHLVAHPKKPQQNGQEPDINDVAGAKEIGGIADNIIFVRRGNSEPTQQGAPVPMKIIVKKQRHWTGEWPTYEGFFQHAYRQFSESPHQSGPLDYLAPA